MAFMYLVNKGLLVTTIVLLVVTLGVLVQSYLYQQRIDALLSSVQQQVGFPIDEAKLLKVVWQNHATLQELGSLRPLVNISLSKVTSSAFEEQKQTAWCTALRSGIFASDEQLQSWLDESAEELGEVRLTAASGDSIRQVMRTTYFKSGCE